MKIMTNFESLFMRRKQRCGSLRDSAAHFGEVVTVSVLGLTRTVGGRQSAPVRQRFLPRDYKLKISY